MTSDSFAWGVGTSAFQIEGAWNADGKGESIWDRFLHESGHRPNGDHTCNHYGNLSDDLDLLVELGVNAYRFSTAWTRVLPDGTGTVNQRGLDFYDRLIDGLIDRGIEPWLTLYHWDLPQVLQDRGGWLARESADWFTEYTQVMADHFGGRVKRWITINEPWVSSFLGHRDGIFAPGHTELSAALASGHHQMLGHGQGVREIRRRVPDARVGIALDCRPARPASPDPEDLAAMHRFDGFRNRWFFDPVFLGRYPQDMVALYADAGVSMADLTRAGDMEAIAEPLDFCGVNFYTSFTVDRSTGLVETSEGPVGAPAQDGFTEMGWKVDAQSLGAFLNRVVADWGPRSIVITENGASFSDGVGEDGEINDQRRIAYLAAHIEQIQFAKGSGVPVDGYFVWSFLDNLEWMSGFDQRFGLVHVDHTTQVRTVKESGRWYADHMSRQ